MNRNKGRRINYQTLKRIEIFSLKPGMKFHTLLIKPLYSLSLPLIFAATFICLALAPSLSQAQPDGEKLFKFNCASCHAVSDKVVIGPGLQGIHERQEMDWLIPWVKNSQEVIKSGDPYANEIYAKYNNLLMTAFPTLSDEEITSIFDYVKAEGEKKAEVAVTPMATEEIAEDAGNKTWIYLLILIVFAVLLYILNRVKNGLEYALREKEGVPHPAQQTFKEATGSWISNNSILVTLAVIVLLVMGSVDGWNRLASIGVYQGYQPEQPIKFSHKLHAGINKIDCKYCHSGAEKSRHANIPSANVCMNCHSYVSEGPIYGETEIAKIYAALDYDPQTKVYGENPKPIKWVRVHTLPDLAYFNHAQHVTVGKVECQTCHGKIEDMEVVEQHAELTMQWCIDCHRTTEVKMEGNAYYDELHAYLVEKHGKEAQLTVDKIGGLECAKCHY